MADMGIWWEMEYFSYISGPQTYLERFFLLKSKVEH